MLYNDFYRQNSGAAGTYFNNVSTQASQYGFMIERKTPASKCIGCKKCEKVCPQHLPIVELLRDKVDGELWAANPDAKLADMTSEL